MCGLALTDADVDLDRELAYVTAKGCRPLQTSREHMIGESWDRRSLPETGGCANARWWWEITRPAELTAARGPCGTT